MCPQEPAPRPAPREWRTVIQVPEIVNQRYPEPPARVGRSAPPGERAYRPASSGERPPHIRERPARMGIQGRTVTQKLGYPAAPPSARNHDGRAGAQRECPAGARPLLVPAELDTILVGITKSRRITAGQRDATRSCASASRPSHTVSTSKPVNPSNVTSNRKSRDRRPRPARIVDHVPARMSRRYRPMWWCNGALRRSPRVRAVTRHMRSGSDRPGRLLALFRPARPTSHP
jgi:hypothetical protein